MRSLKQIALMIFFFPWIALAQSGISGVVKDVSGSVLSGVTVTASSPALIEKSRAVMTNGSGEYKLIDLRPGTYAVTFELQGFTKAERINIALTADFIANVNADLTVGSVSETVQVSAESIGLDIQSSTQQAVLTRQVMDNVPTGHSVFSDGQTQPGIVLSKPDVGGSQGMQQSTIQVHGSQTNDVAFMIDGMPVNSNYGGGGIVGVYYNDGMIQETSYKTSAIPAQYSQGGVVIDMVPKEGGNDFHGSFYGSGMTAGLQFNNVNSAQQAQGLRAGNHFQSMYDVNPSVGGPILRDKLWFFTTVRRWSVNEFVANVFDPTGQQGLEDQRITSVVGRLTWQVNGKNKISAYYDKNMKYRGHRRDTGSGYTSIASESSVIQSTPLGYTGQVKWTSTLTPKMLLEVGASFFFLDYTYSQQPQVNPNAVAVVNIAASTLSNAPAYLYRSFANRRSYVANASYVTGSHSFKFGAILGEAPYRETYTMQGDARVQIPATGSPTILFFNTPVDTREALNADFGLYAQDSWTIKHRLTVNAGVRYELLNLSLLHQTAPAGRYIGARDIAPQSDVPNWNSIVPRIGIAYDPTGRGKTVIKASASMYRQMQAAGYAQNFTQMSLSSLSCTWNGAPSGTNTATLNTNGISLVQTAYNSHFKPAAGIPDQLTNCGQFSANNTTQGADTKRPYSWEYVLSAQREIAPRFTATVSGFYRTNRNNLGTKNLANPIGLYTPVTITTPAVVGYPELSSKTITVYNADKAAYSATQRNVFTNYKELNSQYVGFEITAQKSFGKQNFLSGGYTLGKKTGSVRGTTDDLNNPNLLYNSTGAIELDATHQFRLTGVYVLPWNVKFSGNYLHNTGSPFNPVFTVTNSYAALNQGSQNVALAKPGTYRYPSVDLVDVRMGKVFKLRESMSAEPFFDFYNMLNKSTATTQNASVGSNLGRVSSNIEPRLIRIGLKFNF
ncbi:TonB-dependent receptor [Granulicella sp. dw_53]|uniref:TonB-dependent receptor n=1 Tax=Granulicella sp. dw_53 TaxID=2719792 RepID=UPI001BD6BE22|nr:TonB-dependent receptor [Granulicella sp. dw_53]